MTPTAISEGGNTSLVIGSDGNVYAWGDNEDGQLGNGTTTSSSVPELASLPSGVKAVFVSEDYTLYPNGPYAGSSLAIGTDGNIYGWGDNREGQLGDGSTTASSTPVEISLPGGVAAVAVAGGRATSLAIASDGTLFAWGQNDFGQLGNGTTSGSAVPLPVELPTGVRAISVAAADGTSLCIGSDGILYAWGNNSDGQLGNGTTANTSTPEPVSLPSGVSLTSVATGGATSVGVGSDGNVYAWGDNGHGQLGNGTTTSSSVPVAVHLPAGARALAADTGYFNTNGTILYYPAIYQTSIAITSDGRVYSWGSDQDDALGDGTVANGASTDSPTPVQVTLPVGLTATSISENGDTGLAIAGSTAAGPPTFTAAAPPLAVPAGARYNAIFAASNNPTFQLVDAPTWLSIDAEGAVTGSPSAGTTSFTYSVSATNNSGSAESGPHTVRVQDTSSVRGTVVTPGREPTRVAGAEVQVCAAGECSQATTGSDGTFSANAPIGSSVVITAYPPVNSGYVTTSTGSITVPADGVENETIALDGITPLATGLRINGTSAPTVYWDSPSTATYSGCPNSLFAVATAGENTATGHVDSSLVPLTEDTAGSGTYSGVIPPFDPIHGPASLQPHVECLPASSLTPDSGSANGHKDVSIIGTGFTAASGVRFGSAPALSFSIQSDNLITAVAPPGVGTVSVTVEHGTGTTTVGTYSYQAILSVSPAHGSAAGGTPITIRGSGLGNTNAVLFGSTPAGFTQVSDTQIDTTSPPGAGPVNISIETATGGLTPVTSADQFTYSGPPSAAGGPTVTRAELITPTAPTVTLRPAASGGLDDRNAPDINHVIDDYLITHILPIVAPRLKTLVDVAEFAEHPTCTKFGEAIGDSVFAVIKSGPTYKDIVATAIDATVAGFRGVATEAAAPLFAATIGFTTEVLLDFLVGGLITAAILGVLALTLCPGVLTGLIDPSGAVLDTNGNPISDATVTILRSPDADGPFELVPPDAPGISPGTNPETTTSDGVFHWDVAAGFYEIQASAPGCTNPSEPSSTSTVIGPYPVPPPQTGLTIALACPYASSPPTPTITQLTTDRGPTAGGTPLTVLGTGFTPETAIDFGSTEATKVIYLSPQALQVTSPPGHGDEHVTATNKEVTSTASGSDSFVFENIPAVANVSPSSGPTSGRTRIVITGSGFTGATDVLFNGKSAASFIVESPTTIRAITPAQRAGHIQVAVSNVAGLSPLSDTATFTAGTVTRITSADEASFRVGRRHTFLITTSGVPAAVVTERGRLPRGLRFTADQAGGTARLRGRPGARTGGRYRITLIATNGVGAATKQAVTLLVREPPSVRSASHVAGTVGRILRFVVRLGGFPRPTLSERGTLPPGLRFDPARRSILGIPRARSSGRYPIQFVARNPNGIDLQHVTLIINQA